MKAKLTYIHTSSLTSKKANLIQVLSMCTAFIDNNIDVTLLLPESKDRSEINVDERIKLKFYSVNNRLPSSIKFTIGLSKFLRKNNLEGIIFIRQFTMVSPLLKHKYKFIYESHNNNLFSRRFIDVILKRRLKRIIKNESFLLFFSISGELNKYWNEFFKHSTDKTDFYHDGISHEMFKETMTKEDALAKLDVKKNDKKRVVYAGSLYKDRGINNIVNLAKDFPELDFVVIGGPNSEVPELKSMATELNVNNLEFKGVVKHQEVPTYLYSSDVLLAFWSDKVKTINYCSPLKVFEYMASGRLIVAHAYPTIKEVLNNQNAILIAPNSYESMKEGVLKAVTINNGSDIAEKAREDVLKKYTWKKRAAYVINFINKEVNA